MATLAKNKDDRANAILAYYNNLQTYNEELTRDGDDLDPTSLQGQYDAFNDLIILHHDEMKQMFGYVSAQPGNLLSESGETLLAEDSEPIALETLGSYLPSEEDTIDTTQWWYNANVTNLRTTLFFMDYQYLDSVDSLFAANSTDSPYARHPYVYWNQYHTLFGSWNNYGFVNMAPYSGTGSRYSDTQNPFATGTNYRLREPLEHFGDTSNLLWGQLVWDGTYSYRNRYIGDTSYDTHSESGFNNYERTGVSVGNIENSLVSSWPSPFETFRYTYFGNGSNTSIGSKTINNHSGTYSGTFIIYEASASLTNGWYMVYDGTLGFVFRITGSTWIDADPGTDYTVYSYNSAYYPIPATGDFDNTWTNVYYNPDVPEGAKTGTITDGRDDVWVGVYNRYYSSKYKIALDRITEAVVDWIAILDNFDTFDYTAIEDTTSVQFGRDEASIIRSALNTWLTNWKSLINDSGSGATFSSTGSHWSNANLDAIFSDASGGLNNLIAFGGSSYTGSQSGYISDRRTEIYDDILGWYNLGDDEDWRPNLTTVQYNNTGYLDTGKLYAYRHNAVDARLNREDGSITIARNSYYNYLRALDTVSQLETIMNPVVDMNRYDLTPTGIITTTDEEDRVLLTWDATKAASSYNLQRREGNLGAWVTISNTYGYTDPGSPPDFSISPPNRYEDIANTRGYQEFGLSFVSGDSSTGLSDSFITYDFILSIDGNQATINIMSLDAITFEALRVAIQDYIDDETELEAVVEIVSGDIRIISSKRGNSSTVSIAAGTSNDLLARLSTTPEPAVDGITNLEVGKVYYYRMNVNNGYSISLGSDGNEQDKDWDSQSDYQTTLYLNDIAGLGDAGYLTWDPPANLIVSGIEQEVDASPDYCRLEWEHAANANKYKVYRATSLDGGYALIDETMNNYYEDTSSTPGYVYYYKLQSVANDEHKLFDESGNLSDNLEGLMTDEGVRGKRLWTAPVLEATTDNVNKVTLTWNELSGATGYIIYTSNVETGQYGPITDSNAVPIVVTGNSYVDEGPAIQFFKREFESPTDGLSEDEYQTSTRYYFQIRGTTPAYSYLPIVEEYWIKSPASGVWTAQEIADEIDEALSAGLANATCSLFHMTNPDSHYLIKLTSVPKGTGSFVAIQDGSFEPFLPDILEPGSIQAGTGAYLGMNKYYKIRAVEEVSGNIVRYSEYSNIATGKRELNLPEFT